MNPTEAACPCPKHSHIFWNPGNLPWRQNCPHPRRKGTLVHPQIIKIRHLLNLRNLNIQIFGNISPPHHRSFKHWVSLHYFFACSVVRILFSATKNASARGRKSSANLRLPPPFQLDNQKQHTTYIFRKPEVASLWIWHLKITYMFIVQQLGWGIQLSTILQLTGPKHSSYANTLSSAPMEILPLCQRVNVAPPETFAPCNTVRAYLVLQRYYCMHK